MRGMLGLSMSPIASAIRLAGTSVVSGQTNVVRSILNFNDTQYGTFTDPIILSGDFEIEVICTPGTTGDNNTLIGGDDFSLYLSTTDSVRVIAPRNDSALGARYLTDSEINPEPSKINRITLKRSGNNFTYGTQAATHSADFNDIDSSITLNWIGGMTTSESDTPSFLPDAMSIFSIKIWAGDKATGTLTHEYRLDELDTIYQRNYASIKTAVPFSADTVGGNWVDNGDGSYTYDGAYNQQIIDSKFRDGTLYEVSFVAEINAGAIEVRPAVFGTTTFNTSGNHTVLITADSDGIAFGSVLDAGVRFNGTISSITIREFESAVLENVLSGDWEEISQTSDQYKWLGTTELRRPDETMNANSPSTYDSSVGVLHMVRTDSGHGTCDISESLVAGLTYQFSADAIDYFGPEGPQGITNLGLYRAFSDTVVFGNVPYFTNYQKVSAIGTAVNSASLSMLCGGSSRGISIKNISVKRYLEYAEGVL